MTEQLAEVPAFIAEEEAEKYFAERVDTVPTAVGISSLLAGSTLLALEGLEGEYTTACGIREDLYCAELQTRIEDVSVLNLLALSVMATALIGLISRK